jgi:NAD(P)-dependent dehydrogenase (short-subunit alcohol dehydrogenase family)
MPEVIVVIGAGSIGQAIAWRVSSGRHVLPADLRQGNADAAAEVLSKAGYRRMVELSPAARAGTPDEIGALGALLMNPDGTFITGSDFLMDGGVTASYFYGELARTGLPLPPPPPPPPVNASSR